jgi:hypothetical protein
MQENEETEQEKQPIDMTSDELLDHVFPKRLANKLRKIVRENNEDCETDSDEQDT